MLSGETSVGQYPVESVATMARIVVAAEEELAQVPRVQRAPDGISAAIAKAAAEVGTSVGASALVAFTQSGTTARLLAEHRSPIPLLAFTPTAEVRSQLALTWGVETFLVPAVQHTDEMVRQVDSAMRDLGRMQPGELITIVAGSPPSTAGATNAMRVHRLGDRLPTARPERPQTL
jgi:pyruvate kinase